MGDYVERIRKTLPGLPREHLQRAVLRLAAQVERLEAMVDRSTPLLKISNEALARLTGTELPLPPPPSVH